MATAARAFSLAARSSASLSTRAGAVLVTDSLALRVSVSRARSRASPISAVRRFFASTLILIPASTVSASSASSSESESSYSSKAGTPCAAARSCTDWTLAIGGAALSSRARLAEPLRGTQPVSQVRNTSGARRKDARAL